MRESTIWRRGLKKKKRKEKKLGYWKGIGIENTLRGRDPEGDNQGLGEPVREEEKQG